MGFSVLLELVLQCSTGPVLVQGRPGELLGSGVFFRPFSISIETKSSCCSNIFQVSLVFELSSWASITQQ